VTSRDFWRLLEPIHAVVYFAPEPLAALRAAGYRRFWMGYFAGRAAPLGAASPELVHALFYNFDYRRVSRALPDAWSYAPPEAALRARLAGSVLALRRQLGALADDDRIHIAADLAARAAQHAPLERRPLYAANRSLPTPRDPWHASGTPRRCCASTAVMVMSPHSPTPASPGEHRTSSTPSRPAPPSPFTSRPATSTTTSGRRRSIRSETGGTSTVQAA
jgi:helix-turn-helix protein